MTDAEAIALPGKLTDKPNRNRPCQTCGELIRFKLRARPAVHIPWHPYENMPHHHHQNPQHKPAPMPGSNLPQTFNPPTPTPQPSTKPGQQPQEGSQGQQGQLFEGQGAAEGAAEGTEPDPEPGQEQEFAGGPFEDPNMPNTEAQEPSPLEPSSLPAQIYNALKPYLTADTLALIAKHTPKVLPTPPPTVQVITQTVVRYQDESGTSATTGPVHCQQARLVRYMSVPYTPGWCGVMLAGDAGSGKTRGFGIAANLLGYDLDHQGEMSVGLGVFASGLLGHYDINGLYHSTVFRRGYEFGHAILLDEIDKSAGDVLAVIQAGIDSDRMSFPDGMIARHPRFRLVIAAPTKGFGDTSGAYPSSKVLPADFLSRFVRIDWDVDPIMESAIVASTISDSETLKPWITFVQAARAWSKSELGGKLVISPRATYQGARLIIDGLEPGETLADMARRVVGTAAIDNSTWDRLLRAVPLPKIVYTPKPKPQPLLSSSTDQTATSEPQEETR